MKSYNSYHTCIKQLARSDTLPQKYAANIDRSTIWRWKHENEDKYLGYELTNVQALQQFLERRESDTLIRAYLKVTLALSTIFFKTNQIQKYLNQSKDILVKTLLRYRKVVNIGFILRLLNLSTATYHNWKNQVLYPCQSSALKLCRRIYPNQLTEKETAQLKSLLTDSAFKYWPVCSIAHYARRNNILHISLSTWYNCIYKLGIKRPTLRKKPRNKTGIRARRPHEIWHADITVVKCLNGMKYYVYLLMDNYSRFILNYRVSIRVSAEIRLDSIRNAYQDYIHEPANDTMLLVDGGAENNNYPVDSYIQSDCVSLQKLIAGKDIHFSNSMVEAQNKLIKYYYLFKHPFQNLDELIKLLEWIVKDYNHCRPHHSLGGLTPFESLSDINLPQEKWVNQILEARQARIKKNTVKSCGIC
ncbi:MAG: integrase core domain-containing protein [Bacteroidota bacterium]